MTVITIIVMKSAMKRTVETVVIIPLNRLKESLEDAILSESPKSIEDAKRPAHTIASILMLDLNSKPISLPNIVFTSHRRIHSEGISEHFVY